MTEEIKKLIDQAREFKMYGAEADVKASTTGVEFLADAAEATADRIDHIEGTLGAITEKLEALEKKMDTKE